MCKLVSYAILFRSAPNAFCIIISKVYTKRVNGQNGHTYPTNYLNWVILIILMYKLWNYPQCNRIRILPGYY